MKSKIKKMDGTSKQIEITLAAVKVNELKDNVLSKMVGNVVMPGFRKGKAPRDLVMKRYEEDILDEVKRILVPETYQEVVNENGLDPVSYPELFDVIFNDSGELSFKAKVDTYPEIKLQKYKMLKIKKEKIKVDEKDISDSLEKLQNMYAEFTEKEGEIQKSDFGICDIEASIDGKEISKKRENAWIEADKDASMLGLGEKLEGLKKGDTKDVEVTLPENYPDKKYAGKDALFKLTVKDVREKKVLPINDELAKKSGKETLNELKSEIKDQLLKMKEQKLNNSIREQVAKQLIEKHVFLLPGTMVQRQKDVIVKHLKEEMVNNGMNDQSIEEYLEQNKAEIKNQAENKIKLFFVMSEIANKEGISCTESEVEDAIQKLAEHYKKDHKEVMSYYKENNLLSGVQEQIVEDKVFDLLINDAVVSEK